LYRIRLKDFIELEFLPGTGNLDPVHTKSRKGPSSRMLLNR
jgi:hypothetical protein